MVLVEAGQPAVDALIESLPGWVASPEQTYKVPDPRPKPR
jgi:hypothetical protein